MITLRRIRIYPIKSLDGIDLKQCELMPSGPLTNDRRWAIVDRAGKWVNGKRSARFHLLEATYSDDLETVQLRARSEQQGEAFHLGRQQPELSKWLSEFLDLPVRLIEDRASGFPDDTNATGPTVCSTQALAAVGNWFELSVEEVLRRMRTNLEIEGCPAFWEDLLIDPAGTSGFQIGDARLIGTNPCARCVVPTRDSYTGEAARDFTLRFIEQRRATLNAEVDLDAFDHFYRFSLNTRVLHPAAIALGDRVSRATGA